MKIVSRIVLVIALFSSACSTTRTISTPAKDDYVRKHLLDDSSLQNAHVGVSVYEVETGKYLYDFQGDKFFTPASNVKLVSCYAAMKYLGEYLEGMQYAENDTAIYLLPTGDPTLLHPDYKKQPVIEFLQRSTKKLHIIGQLWQSKAWGAGWSWDDYNDDYMCDRSPLPVYGNVVEWVQENNATATESHQDFEPSPSIYSIPEVNWKVRFTADTSRKFFVRRNLDENVFHITQGAEKKAVQYVPFVTNGLEAAVELLPDTIGKAIDIAGDRTMRQLRNQQLVLHSIQSQPLDSMLKPMMYRSDNMFAEQCLQMVGFHFLNEMNDRKLIDTLLKTILSDLPQKPSWADGSGLSRFNLFSPHDFVVLLNKMEKDFGMERLKHILPTGGNGTLRNYYKSDSSFIYAKTGTLTGVVALSGFLFTQQNKTLIFSVLVNNHMGNAAAIRRKIEAFLTGIRNNH